MIEKNQNEYAMKIMYRKHRKTKTKMDDESGAYTVMRSARIFAIWDKRFSLSQLIRARYIHVQSQSTETQPNRKTTNL